MPLLKIASIQKHSAWAVWHINESPEVLSGIVAYHENDINAIKHPQKRAESLAARCCVESLCRKFGLAYTGIEKDQHQKPHLAGQPQVGISVAHSFPYAVAMIHLLQPCGIDIEQIDPKVSRVAHKFLNEQEAKWAGEDVRNLIIIWSAKETLYKCYGRKQLIFKDQLHVGSLQSVHPQKISGSIMTEDSKKMHTLVIEQIEDFIITFLYE